MRASVSACPATGHADRSIKPVLKRARPEVSQPGLKRAIERDQLAAALRIAENSAALASLCRRSLAFGMAELMAITRLSSG